MFPNTDLINALFCLWGIPTSWTHPNFILLNLFLLFYVD